MDNLIVWAKAQISKVITNPGLNLCFAPKI